MRGAGPDAAARRGAAHMRARLEVDEEVEGVLEVVVLAHLVLVDHLLRVVRNVQREETCARRAMAPW